MRAAIPWAGALVLFVWAATIARADVGDYLGKPVASVRVEIEGREVTDPKLLQVVETQAGAPLSMMAVRETVSRLFALGRFEDVRVHADTAGDAVSLLYDLVPVHPVDKIDFTGALGGPGIDTGRLRRAVVERFGTSPPVGRAPDLVLVIEGDLHAEGYLHPTVTSHAQLQHSPDRATLVFDIEPGARAHIGDIDVTGAPGVSRMELLALLGISAGSPYRSEALATRIARYVDNRRSRGYFEAKLTPAATFADDDRTVHLTLDAEQGPHVRVMFEGDPLPLDRRNELVPIEREGSADEDLLEDSSNRIEDYLRAEGYRDAAAPHARKDTDGELTITFAVKKGLLYRVAQVDIYGDATLPLADFAGQLRVRAGQPFSAARLDADVSTIEDVYRRRGFAGVSVQADEQPAPSDASASEVPVTVHIEITENVRTVVGSVRVQGNASVPAADLLGGPDVEPGAPFFLAQMARHSDVIEQAYANRGFQSATVDFDPGLSADHSRADVVFTVHEGPRLFVDHILIVGNVRTKTETIERELQFKPGDPLSQAAVAETERRLGGLGLFRRTDITAIGHGEDSRDVLVTLDEAPVTTVAYGGGVEVDDLQEASPSGVAEQRLEFAPRASFQIGRRNLFGKNRSVNLFTSLTLRPRQSVVYANQAQEESGGTYGFPEYQILGTFREPHVLGTPADALLTATLEQQIRSSFNFAERALNAEVAHRVTRAVSISGSYQIQSIKLFDEAIALADQPLVDRAFPQVFLSSFSGSLIYNTRDDPIDPTRGEYVSANSQLAAREIGSEVGFLKSYLKGQLFRTIPHSNHIVLATNATLGLAEAFPRYVLQPDGTVAVVSDIPESERFFAGGGTTVRGFAQDQLGTPATIDQNGFPIGGDAVVILNAEVRVPYRRFQLVGFFDTGNVFAQPSNIDLGQLRSAVGVGIRYRSPIGPIRVDLGFKVHRQIIMASGERESLTALQISLGQAF